MVKAAAYIVIAGVWGCAAIYASAAFWLGWPLNNLVWMGAGLAFFTRFVQIFHLAVEEVTAYVG